MLKGCAEKPMAIRTVVAKTGRWAVLAGAALMSCGGHVELAPEPGVGATGAAGSAGSTGSAPPPSSAPAGSTSAEGGSASGVVAPTTDKPSASVSFILAWPASVTLTIVHYVVQDSAQPPSVVAEGDLPLGAAVGEATFTVPLPSGQGYHIQLSAAEPASDIMCASAFGPFDATPANALSVRLPLGCNHARSGETTSWTDECPRLVLEDASAFPSTQVVGSVIAVTSTALDLDGKVVTYAWSTNSAAGTFGVTNRANATFTCEAPGSPVILSVTANNGECAKMTRVSVACVGTGG